MILDQDKDETSNVKPNADNRISLTWGVDGYGKRHYLCAKCEEVFGAVDPDTIKHECRKRRRDDPVLIYKERSDLK